LQRLPKQIPIVAKVWAEYLEETNKIEEYQDDIPGKIRFILAELNISQYELSKQLRGVKRQEINFWLTEKRKPDIYSAIWLTLLYKKLKGENNAQKK